MKKIQLLSLVAVAVFSLMVGCNSNESDNTEDKTADKGNAKAGKHAHGEGPHGGTVADWGGGKFHVEFTVNHDKKEATVYILGDDEKTATPIDANEITLSIKDPKFTASLKANPQDGDPEGKASRFVGKHENLGIVKEYEGSMSGAVSGTPYSGNFKEVAH